jgi:hypothetical protein
MVGKLQLPLWELEFFWLKAKIIITDLSLKRVVVVNGCPPNKCRQAGYYRSFISLAENENCCISNENHPIHCHEVKEERK